MTLTSAITAQTADGLWSRYETLLAVWEKAQRNEAACWEAAKAASARVREAWDASQAAYAAYRAAVDGCK